jgi:hypothetical protein
MIANDNVQWDDKAHGRARQATAIVASAEFRGRTDLLEIAVVSTAKQARWHRDMLALNKARLASATKAVQEFHRWRINAVMDRIGAESRRFDAIMEAMDDETRDQFLRLALPSDGQQG